MFNILRNLLYNTLIEFKIIQRLQQKIMLPRIKDVNIQTYLAIN